MAHPCPPWQAVQPYFSMGWPLSGSAGCVLKGLSAFSKPFQRIAWWQVMQRSARRISETQICWTPEGIVLAFSAPSFSTTCPRNAYW